MLRPMSCVALLWACGGPCLAAEPPRLDIEATCRAAQPLGPEDTDPVQSGFRDEAAALAELKALWSGQPTSHENECVSETQVAGYPSYVDVLTCLQMYRSGAVATNLRSRHPGKRK
jgi:hypothetical protein